MKKIKYEKDINKNLDKRFELNDLLRTDKKSADYIKKLCEEDILFWFNYFCWTYDPRKPVSNIPFILYDFQETFVLDLKESIDTGSDLIIEKSRDMGLSWLVVLVFQWYFLFKKEGSHFLIGSYKEPMVDSKGAMDTLFEKFRYNLYKQPKMFQPKGYIKGEHDKVLLITNPETGAYVKGSTINQFFGSGGRYKAVLFDEFAKALFVDESAWRSASDTTKCKIAVSSSNGKKNYFYKLRSGEVGNVKVLRLHWTLHPEKDEEWYAAEKARRSKLDLAREVDIDYADSVEGRAFGNWDRRIHVGEYEPNLNLGLELNLDFNFARQAWCVSQTIHGHRYTFHEFDLEYMSTEQACMEFIRHFASHPTKIVEVYGDPAGWQRVANSKWSNYALIERVLRKYGWRVDIRVPRKATTQDFRIKAYNKRLKDWEHNDKSWETITENCKLLIDSIEQTQVDENKVTKGGDMLILKDGTEHFADSISYRAAFEELLRQTNKIYS